MKVDSWETSLKTAVHGRSQMCVLSRLLLLSPLLLLCCTHDFPDFPTC